jgi:2-oxoglutarate dehydrogenase E2 component (dihydrolipoamide succinyltransferase)
VKRWIQGRLGFDIKEDTTNVSDIKVPELGESILEATVGTWLKKAGESVEAGDAVVELETDKVNVEVIAEESGVLQTVLKQTGETVQVGEVIAVIGQGTPTATAPEPSTNTVKHPASETLSGAAANVVHTPPPESPKAPNAPVGQAAPSTANSGRNAPPPLPPRATPAVRRMAAERGVDLTQIQPSAVDGRIHKEDILSQSTQRSGNSAMPANATGPQRTATVNPAQADTSSAAGEMPYRYDERVRMSRRRLTIAKRLVEAQHTAAMLTTFNEIDMSNVINIRKRRKESFKEQYGVGLGFMSFFTKAVIGALKAIPRLNAEIQGEDMIIKHYYDIGIAVATEAGLVVPVVRDADRMSFAEIEQAIASLATRARSNQLTLQELQGGTFTITNGGTFGSLMSTPILNAPQVGILGMHKIQERPVAMKGEVVVRPMMYVALSYDHRIVDGSEAVRFLVKVKELLEDPESLLLEG